MFNSGLGACGRLRLAIILNNVNKKAPCPSSDLGHHWSTTEPFLSCLCFGDHLASTHLNISQSSGVSDFDWTGSSLMDLVCVMSSPVGKMRYLRWGGEVEGWVGRKGA